MTRWTVGLCVLSLGLGPLAACSRENPAFGDEAPATTTVSDTAGEADSGDPPPPDGTSDPGTTGKAETGDDAAGTTSDVTGSTTDPPVEETGPEPICDTHPNAAFHLNVSDPLGNPWNPKTCDQVEIFANGNLFQAANELQHVVCDGCNCPPGDGVTINFDAAVEIPALPECVSVVLWAGPDAAGGCQWDGVAVLPDSTTPIPLWFALSSRSFPPSVFGNVAVDLVEDSLCPELSTCGPTSGTYALSFFDGAPAYQGVFSDVVIGFYAAVPYSVFNRMSFIDLECSEHVSFTGAQIQ